MNAYIALFLSLVLAGYKIFKPNMIIHNITEVFIYGGLAAIFVPIMNLFAVIMLLILISVYDFIAVFKIKHMVTMAKFQTKAKVFAGLLIPYGKEKGGKLKKGGKGVKVKSVVRTAILGGGDIGFPLLFAGVVMKGMILTDGFLIGFLKTLIIPIVVSVALFLLFVKGKKDKFYPAMPFLTAGCFIGYAILFLVNLL
jgi:presenilin-like A22 family membrane protease